MGKQSTSIVLATRNRHKADEIRAILSDQFRFLTLNDFPDAPAVVEDAGTFAGNATKKAVELAQWLAAYSKLDTQSSKVFVLADDSGLEVDALDGAPGVNSARFAALDSGAAGNSSDAANNAKLLRLLDGISVSRRTARFRCVLALTLVPASHCASEARPGGARSTATLHLPTAQRDGLRWNATLPEVLWQTTQLFEGVCEGRIANTPRGENGFGYDPFFVPNGFEQSFAELGEAVKNQISHRAHALMQMKASGNFTGFPI